MIRDLLLKYDDDDDNDNDDDDDDDNDDEDEDDYLLTYFFYSQLRENIINSITKLKMNDTKSVNQIASVLVEATKEEAAITPTSGVSSINIQLSFTVRIPIF